MARFSTASGFIFLLMLGTSAGADSTPDPLRLVPDHADFFVRLDEPVRLLNSILEHPQVKKLQQLQVLNEFLESTNYRRFHQFVGYFEKKLGAGYQTLLDDLAGGGAVLAGQFGGDGAPVLAVVQSKNKQKLADFVKLSLEVLESETARLGTRVRFARRVHQGTEVMHAGNDLHIAIVDTALVVSNKAKAIERAIELQRADKPKNMARVEHVAEARRLLGEKPLAWLWLNWDTVKKRPEAKAVLKTQRDDPQLTVLFGGWLDIVERSPYLCVGLYEDAGAYTLSARMPRGREGMPQALALHVPPAGQPGSRPLLEPRGVIFSTSYFLDISKFWEYRKQLLNDKQVKALEDFDKSSTNLPTGHQFSKMAVLAGAYHRFVIAQLPASDYRNKPTTPSPAYGLVLEMRRPDVFPKKMEALLRAGAVLATLQVKLKQTEVMHNQHKIVCYRFLNDGSFSSGGADYRYNFSPSFAAVNNQFIATSSLELCRELVDQVTKESETGSGAGQSSTVFSQVYGAGGAQLLEAFKDRILVQAMLGQALSPEMASEQVQTAIEWVRNLGVLQIESHYGSKAFRYDLRFKLNK